MLAQPEKCILDFAYSLALATLDDRTYPPAPVTMAFLPARRPGRAVPFVVAMITAFDSLLLCRGLNVLRLPIYSIFFFIEIS